MPYYDLEYRGARLRVEVDDQMRSSLYINGLQRDSQDAETLPARCRLSSSVQTDYEWHEFIEAEIILFAIGHYQGRMAEVARRLGIGRSTLYRKLAEMGIERPR